MKTAVSGLAHGAALVLAVALLAACASPPTSSARIGASTASPPSASTSLPVGSGVHLVYATFVEAKSRSFEDINALAEERAQGICAEHVVQDRKLRTGEEATSHLRGILGPWVELKIQCALAPTEALDTAPAELVTDASRKLDDTEYFDIHAERFNAPVATVFAAVVKVLTDQGDPVFRADLASGLIITGRARHGVIGLPSFDQYVVVVDAVSDSARVTIKVLSHWREMEGVKPTELVLKPIDRVTVYGKAIGFMRRVRSAVGG